MVEGDRETHNWEEEEWKQEEKKKVRFRVTGKGEE